MRAQPNKSIRNGVNFGRVRVFSHDLSPEAYLQFSSTDRIAWDIETSGLDPETAKIGTCQLYSPTAGACVVTRVNGSTPKLLSRLLSDEKVTKVFHHAPFDLSFMTYAWNAQPRNIACTKIAEKLLHPTAPAEEYSLKFLMKRHFGMVLDKQVRFTDWLSESLSERQLEYAVGDVVMLLDLYELQEHYLKEADASKLYQDCLSFLPTAVKLRIRHVPDVFSY